MYFHLIDFEPTQNFINNSFCLFLIFKNSTTRAYDSIVISIVNYIAHNFQCDDQVMTMYIISKRSDNRSLGAPLDNFNQSLFTQRNLTL